MYLKGIICDHFILYILLKYINHSQFTLLFGTYPLLFPFDTPFQLSPTTSSIPLDFKLLNYYLFLPRGNFHTLDLRGLVFPKELGDTQGLVSRVDNEGDLLDLVLSQGVNAIVSLLVQKDVRVDSASHQKVLKVS